MEVIDTESMTPEQKLTTLEHWEANARLGRRRGKHDRTGRSHLGEMRPAIVALRELEELDEKSADLSDLAQYHAGVRL